MSTRTQIRFVDPSGNQVAQLYKHSDGYPDNIVPMLDELREVLATTGWGRGPNYAAAQFVFMDKLGSMRFCAEKVAGKLTEQDVDKESDYGLYAELKEQDGVGPARAEAATQMADMLTDLMVWGGDIRPYFLGGHGVEQGNIHGDEEYIYEVTVPGYHDEEGWSVKVSANFEEPEVELRDGSYRGHDYAEGTDAWSECTWEYDGMLTDAAAIIEAARDTDKRDMLALREAEGRKVVKE